jgi:hypothetical protein
MNSPQIAVSQAAGQMRVRQSYAYHESVDLGVIAVRQGGWAACVAEADG